MSRELSRRDLVKTGVAGLCIPAFAGESLASGTDARYGTPSNTLTIETFEGGPLVSYEFVVEGAVTKGPDADANDAITDVGGQTRVAGEAGNGYPDDFYVEHCPSSWSANVDSDHYRVLFNGVPIDPNGRPSNTLTIETFEDGPLVSYEFVVEGDVEKGPEADGNDAITDVGSQTRVAGETGNGYSDDFYVESRPSEWSANVDSSHYRVLFDGTEIHPGRPNDVEVETVNASPEDDRPRYVTFTGHVSDVPDDATVVGFEYENHNAMWFETDTKRLTAGDATEFSITEKMPYVGAEFPYRAVARVEGGSEHVGEKQTVSVPNFIDTVEVETVDVSVSGTSATVHGRIADFGKATTVEANAHFTSGTFEDVSGPQSYYAPSDRKELSDEGSRDFYVTMDGLDPNTDYEARTVAKIPNEGSYERTYGNVVEFTTGD